jgi:hypothetical protein
VTTNTKQFGRAKPRKAIAPKRFLAPKDLPAKGIHYHGNHLRKLWNAGKFPTPVRLSAHRIAWPEEVIDAWMDSKVKGVA